MGRSCVSARLFERAYQKRGNNTLAKKFIGAALIEFANLIGIIEYGSGVYDGSQKRRNGKKRGQESDGCKRIRAQNVSGNNAICKRNDKIYCLNDDCSAEN